MPKGGRTSTSFKPGVSGNPSGRPKLPETIEARRVMADVKSAARELTPVAMDTLEKAMMDQKAPWAAKIAAAIAVLDRGWGKPAQTVSANVSVFDQMTDDEQKTLLAALAALKAEENDDQGLPNCLCSARAGTPSGENVT
jgi:Family of unknown function (DUF5681)